MLKLLTKGRSVIMSQSIAISEVPTTNAISIYIKNVSDAQTSLFYYLESRLKSPPESLGKEFVRLEVMRSLRYLLPEQQDIIRRLLQDS